MFQAEEIVIPEELAGILKEYAKEVIRHKPASMDEINRISYEFFSKRVEEKDELEESKESAKEEYHVERK